VDSPDPKREQKAKGLGGRISLQTLIIASLASAAASFAASRIWGAGTIVSAAATPVIVALVSEFLRRPVQTVAETAMKVPTAQTLPAIKRAIATPNDPTHGPAEPTHAPAQPTHAPAEPTHAPAQPTDAPAEPTHAPAEPTQTPAEPTQAPAEPTHAPNEPELESRSEQPLPMRPDEASTASTSVVDPEATKPTADAWRPRWRLAIVTGLLAFAIVVAIYTVPDILAGRSITGNGQPTTFFGATRTVSTKASHTSTVTATTSTTTVTEASPTTTVTKTTPATTTSTTTSTKATSTTKAPAPAVTQTTTAPTTTAAPPP
jgi:hypothetical protein